MKKLANLLKKAAITFLLTAVLIGSTEARLLVNYDNSVSTLSEDDSYFGNDYNK